MKITIELTEAEVKGLKAYLTEVDDIKVGKNELRIHCQNIISSVINAPQESSSQYIAQYQNK